MTQNSDIKIRKLKSRSYRKINKPKNSSRLSENKGNNFMMKSQKLYKGSLKKRNLLNEESTLMIQGEKQKFSKTRSRQPKGMNEDLLLVSTEYWNKDEQDNEKEKAYQDTLVNDSSEVNTNNKDQIKGLESGSSLLLPKTENNLPNLSVPNRQNVFKMSKVDEDTHIELKSPWFQDEINSSNWSRINDSLKEVEFSSSLINPNNINKQEEMLQREKMIDNPSNTNQLEKKQKIIRENWEISDLSSLKSQFKSSPSKTQRSNLKNSNLKSPARIQKKKTVRIKVKRIVKNRHYAKQ